MHVPLSELSVDSISYIQFPDLKNPNAYFRDYFKRCGFLIATGKTISHLGLALVLLVHKFIVIYSSGG